MRINKIYIYLIVLLVLNISCNRYYELKVAPVFSDHMVLQQTTNVTIWGSGSPGNDIEVISSWGEKSKNKISEDGSWNVLLKTPNYGGPYEVKIISAETEIILEDVMVGEVWLASGQSNMEWPMSARILNQNDEINSANYPKIRMFSVPRNLNGKNIYNAKWEIANRKILKISGCRLFFCSRNKPKT